MEVDVDDVVVAPRRRTLRQVEELAESMQQVGLLNPITITEVGNHLIAGYHRLEAAKRLQWKKIRATRVPLDGLMAELAEIDENLIRNELDVLERAEHLKRRKNIYEALWPETKRGVAGGKTGGRGREKIASEMISFAKDTAKKTQHTPRSIQQDIQIAEHLAEPTKDRADYTYITQRLEHGIEQHHYRHYLRVEEITGTPVWLFVYEIQTGDILYERLHTLIPYKRETNKMGKYGMVFFPRERFRILCNVKER